MRNPYVMWRGALFELHEIDRWYKRLWARIKYGL